MKAIAIDGYGGPERLVLRDLPDPRPGPGEMLVRVRAAGVNPVDWKIRRGELRLVFWIEFPYIPGGDIAGEVVDGWTGRDPVQARRSCRGVRRPQDAAGAMPSSPW